MSTLLASQQLLASGSGGLNSLVSLVWLIIFIVLVVDIWRTNAGTGAKIGWTIFALLCGLIALIVWFVWGKRRYSGGLV